MAEKTMIKLNEGLNGHLPLKLEEDTQPVILPDVPLSESELEELRRTHPLAHLIGKYKDEPLWDEWMAAIEEYRQERNAQEDVN
jgi:hypothetical protein